MSETRLLFRVAPLAIALAVFLFGTQVMGQTTYTWTGASTNSGNWTDTDNWSPSGYPSSTSDNATFSNTANGKVVIDGNVTIGTLAVTDDQQMEFSGSFTLQVNNFSVLNASLLEFNTLGNAPTFRLNASGTLSTGSRMTQTYVNNRPLTFNVYGTLAMGTLDQSTYIGENINTNIYNDNFITSDLVFLGDLYITDRIIPLGSWNLYLGPESNLFGAATSVSTNGGPNNGTFTCIGDAFTREGTLCKGFNESTEDQYFTFPLAFKDVNANNAEGTTFLHFKVNSNCVSGSYDATTIPFPHIATRVVWNGTGNSSGKHPASGASGQSWHHWPVYYFGMPSTTGLTGYVQFHNNYRSSGTTIFSALYYPHIETYNPAGPYGGLWYVDGSEDGTINGVTVTVPFGGYTDPTVDCMYGPGDIGVGVGDSYFIPVELTSFSARYYDNEKRVELKWMTATELNNLGFWVERSTDGDRWETLEDFVPGSGTSNVPLSYSFNDRLDERMATHPKIAYRLRQVDRDGTIDYSSIVYVHTGVQPETVELYKAYPNPFNPSTTLSFSLEEAANVTLRVYNTLGMEVATLLEGSSMDAGFHNIEFHGTDLTSGVYIAVLEAADIVQQQKLVLNK